jgi:hypothetical protein
LCFWGLFLQTSCGNSAANQPPRIVPACRDFRDSSRVLNGRAEMNGARAAFAQRAGPEAKRVF